MLAAGLGAFLRLQTLQLWSAPWGTLVVNIAGSLLMGFLAVYLAKHAPHIRLIVLVAFLGSLTTFSSYSLDIVRLFEDQMPGKAFLYLFLSNSLCVISCFVGWKIAQSLVIEN